MEKFEFAGFSFFIFEVSILLGCDPGSLGNPYPKFQGIFKALNVKCTPQFLDKFGLLLCRLHCTRSLLGAGVCCLILPDCGQTCVPS